MHHCHHRCPHGRHPHNNYLQNWNVFSCFASLDFLTEAQPIQSLWLCPMDSRRSDKKKKSINRPTEYFQGRQHNTKQCWIFSYHLVCASLQKIYTNKSEDSGEIIMIICWWSMTASMIMMVKRRKIICWGVFSCPFFSTREGMCRLH